MEPSTSLKARRELLNSIRERYRQAAKSTKTKILDEFMESTGYGRKHAVALLNKDRAQTLHPQGIGRKREYDEEVKETVTATA